MQDPSPAEPETATTMRRPALLVALSREPVEATTSSLKELRKLLRIVGVDSAGQLARVPVPGGELGGLGAEGRATVQQALKEVACPAGRLPLLVFNGELGAAQERIWADALQAEVLCRTEVILRVFEARALSPTARLEVELARLTHEAPRAAASAARSPGHGRPTQLQLKQQLLRVRMAEIRRELTQAQRETRERQTQSLPTGDKVALVGYTNAGKSSLMRALTGVQTTILDQPFATLTTDVQTLGTKPPVLVADTVGFIRNLPQDLMASFRSTLEQALEAGLIVHVVDASDPEWRTQLQVTREILEEIGAATTPRLLMFNKADKLDSPALEALRVEQPDAHFGSAHLPEDVERLRAALLRFFDTEYAEAVFEVPFARSGLMNAFRSQAHVLEHRYTATGAVVRVRARPELLSAWREALIAPSSERHPGSVDA